MAKPKVKTEWKVGKYTGPKAFSNYLSDYNKSVQKEAQGRLRGAAAYCRRVARNSMRPSGKPKKVAGLPWKVSKPSAPGKAPRYRKGKKLKNIRYSRVDKNTYQIYPHQFSGSGSNTSFAGKGDVFAEVGGSGSVRLPMTLQSMSAKQRTAALSGASWPMVWKNSNYRARPYLAPARDLTIEKFPSIFTNLNVRKR